MRLVPELRILINNQLLLYSYQKSSIINVVFSIDCLNKLRTVSESIIRDKMKHRNTSFHSITCHACNPYVCTPNNKSIIARTGPCFSRL